MKLSKNRYNYPIFAIQIEFFLISNNEIFGKRQLESFMLLFTDDNIKDIFYINEKKFHSVKISEN
jgi:hypothetical protein